MRRSKIIWSTVLVISLLLLIGYGIYEYTFARNTNFGSYGPGYYGSGMMSNWFGTNTNNNQRDYVGKEKMSIDKIRDAVENYIQIYNDNLEIADIFVFKDTDYYVSIQEKDTGKGAIELLVNPYTGDVYPENGPNITWNEKYAIYGGSSYGMMGSFQQNRNNRNYRDEYTEKYIDRNKAIKIANEYAKRNIDKDFSVLDEGREFYGYYTFQVNEGDKPVGMLSVNYYTGDIWFHNWHGQLENIITNDKK